MEQNPIMKILADLSKCELEIFYYRYVEAKRRIFEEIPDHDLYEEVSRDEYESFTRFKAIICEARELALDKTMLQILRSMKVSSDSNEEKSVHPGLIPEIVQFLKYGRENSFENQKETLIRALYKKEGQDLYQLQAITGLDKTSIDNSISELEDDGRVFPKYEERRLVYYMPTWWKSIYSTII